MSLARDDVVADRWQVRGRVGSGTFCELYLARDLSGKRRGGVALKVEKRDVLADARHSVLRWEASVLRECQRLRCVPRFVSYARAERACSVGVRSRLLSVVVYDPYTVRSCFWFSHRTRIAYRAPKPTSSTTVDTRVRATHVRARV